MTNPSLHLMYSLILEEKQNDHRSSLGSKILKTGVFDSLYSFLFNPIEGGFQFCYSGRRKEVRHRVRHGTKLKRHQHPQKNSTPYINLPK